ncbi:fluoride efflux transporter FluC [Pelagibacterium lacus]|uniref:Fluoride-specific ion channel FluC n=1 Tax=Pelagibacterium lacus TaxID=2282655 RepID=A0A369W0Z9_9HYPH|nr:CrcB family protein [Pelagibacterium lacus]RDE08198.1 CrcB family protein [Pelagibacterium lacus]
MSDWRLSAAIAGGGALGSLARYGASVAAAATMSGPTVWGTLSANICGSFLIGLIAIWAARRFPPPLVAGFLVTGFCGGFTTFSVFSLETLMLAAGGQWAGAAGYVALSITSWLGAVWLGWEAGARLFPARS